MSERLKLTSEESGLLEAIEFFSQRFAIEQITQYAFNFTKKMLEPAQIAVFVENDDEFEIVETEGFSGLGFTFEASLAYTQCVMLHAGLFAEADLAAYLPKELLEIVPASLGIPLIMDKELYGMILLKGKKSDFSQEEHLMGTALMNLFYNALTNYKWYHELDLTRKSLDDKIFSLFAMNQSSKVLMSTLEFDVLAKLSMSVFSELTQSKITSLYTYDELSERFILAGYHNVHQNSELQKVPVAFQTQSIGKLTQRHYYDLSDREALKLFEACFDNDCELREVNQINLLIPIAKEEHIIGFVTLSDRVNGEVYQEGLIELIDSLAVSLYIALANAQAMATIQQQNKLIEEKAQELQSLHYLIRNINSSKKIEHLYDITLATLHQSYGVTCGFLAKYDREMDVFQVKACQGFEMTSESLRVSGQHDELNKGKTIIAPSIQATQELLPKKWLLSLEGLYSGALLIPITIRQDEEELLGLIGIMDLQGMVINESVHLNTFETLAGTIGPIWKQLSQAMDGHPLYQKRPDIFFKQVLKQAVEEVVLFDRSLYVHHLYDRQAGLFQEREWLDKIEEEHHKISVRMNEAHLMVITDEPWEIWEGSKSCPSQVEVKSYAYEEDFNRVEELVELIRRNG